MSEPCPGGCNARYRAGGEGEPWPGEPTWCHRCKARIRAALAELEYLGALLAAVADGHHEQPLNPSRIGRYTASPSSAADDLEELKSLLYESEDQYRAWAGYANAPRHGYLALVTTEIITWLLAHFDGIMAAPFAGSFGTEVLQLHRSLTSKAKAGTGRHGKPVPCPRCDYKTLTLTEGDDYIRCINTDFHGTGKPCGRRLSLAEYDEYAAAIARSCSA